MPRKSFLDRLLDAWWGKFALGVFIVIITCLMFADFTKLERGQIDHVWGPKAVIMAYELAGKWPPVIVMGLIGGGTAAWGVWQLVTGKE